MNQILPCNEQAVKRAQIFLCDTVPGDRTQDMAAMYAALGDPTRLRLLLALSAGELCVGDLSLILGVSASAVSHQLRGLKALRLVRPRRDGKMILYSLDDDHIFSLLKLGIEHASENEKSTKPQSQ
ncbi:MAG TPA: metalloregulator ArsR/SmtB family transcription factor, partial [Abditibacteriaceae bacterium]